MHDQWLGLLAESRGNVELLRRPLLLYRRHGGTATKDTHGPVGSMLRNRMIIWRALRGRS